MRQVFVVKMTFWSWCECLLYHLQANRQFRPSLLMWTMLWWCLLEMANSDFRPSHIESRVVVIISDIFTCLSRYNRNMKKVGYSLHALHSNLYITAQTPLNVDLAAIFHPYANPLSSLIMPFHSFHNFVISILTPIASPPIRHPCVRLSAQWFHPASWLTFQLSQPFL